MDFKLVQNIPKHDRDMMKKYGKVVGYFEGTVPNLWITDIDIIKTVFVKDFDHFVNRRVFNIFSSTKIFFLLIQHFLSM